MGICSKCNKRVKGTSSSYLMSERSRNMIDHEKTCKGVLCKSCKQPLSKVETTYDFGKTYSQGLMCTNKTCKLLHKTQNDEVVN